MYFLLRAGVQYQLGRSRSAACIPLAYGLLMLSAACDRPESESKPGQQPTEVETPEESGLSLEGLTFDRPTAGHFNLDSITLREVPGTRFKELVDERLEYTDSTGAVWAATKGTWTDGASVPRLALWVTDGRFDHHFLKAAVIHDAYCQRENATRCRRQFQARPWRKVHRMFYEAALIGGTPETRAQLMFAAVWLGGPRWNDPGHDLSTVSEDVLRVEYKACEAWITKDKRTVEDIEAWMDRREEALLSQR